jgi:ectoine hydroxylase-related dioxygenase (phytanoyl-CoA dioxygenase family)
VVRERAIDPAACRRATERCEALVARLVAGRQARRARAGSYVFALDRAHETVVKWEGESDVVHGIEPIAHLDSALASFAEDPRFVEPMIDVLGHPEPALFTEKLNLKRPERGGVNPLHQDFPYWVGVAEDAAGVATAMLFLDDATRANGCLEVVPGSHTSGRWATRADGDSFAANEIDAAQYPDVAPLPLEVPAGSVVFFGAMLVHRSAPNTSTDERRALLFSYQPAGRTTQLDALRALLRSRAPTR